MPDINIKLKGISGPSYDLTIDSEAQTRELYDKVFELIGGQGTGMNLNNLRLVTVQKEMRHHAMWQDSRSEVWSDYPKLKDGERAGPIKIKRGRKIAFYLEGGEVVHYFFKMENPPQLAARAALRAGGRVRSKRNKRRKSKKRKSKKRKTKKRRSN